MYHSQHFILFVSARGIFNESGIFSVNTALDASDQNEGYSLWASEIVILIQFQDSLETHL